MSTVIMHPPGDLTRTVEVPAYEQYWRAQSGYLLVQPGIEAVPAIPSIEVGNVAIVSQLAGLSADTDIPPAPPENGGTLSLLAGLSVKSTKRRARNE